MRFGKLKAQDKIQMQNRRIYDEILLGVVQGFAILPGISRSGVTTTYLLLRGFKREDAFKLSFIISLPAICGAIAFDLLFGDVPLVFDWTFIIILLIVAILGYLTMGVLLKVAKKVSFDIICYVLGGITLGLVILYSILTIG